MVDNLVSNGLLLASLMACEILEVVRIVLNNRNLVCDGNCIGDRCCTLSHLLQSPDADNNATNQIEEIKETVIYASYFEENNGEVFVEN